jgi:hypothetical protein
LTADAETTDGSVAAAQTRYVFEHDTLASEFALRDALAPASEADLTTDRSVPRFTAAARPASRRRSTMEFLFVRRKGFRLRVSARMLMTIWWIVMF